MCRRSILTAVWAIVFCVGSPTYAARWIVKNPKISDHQSLQHGLSEPLDVKHDIYLGATHYVVVDVNFPRRQDKMSLNHEMMEIRTLLAAEAVTPDLKITLDIAPSSRQKLSDYHQTLVATDEVSAWHVDQLKYAQLPTEKAGQGVLVAVIDTGLDVSHPALVSHLSPRSYSIVNHSSDVTDRQGHGTHCAGIVVSSPKSTAVNAPKGIAPQAKLFSVQIIGGSDEGFLSDAVAGIKYAVDQGANILSNSWHVNESWQEHKPTPENLSMLESAVTYAESHHVIYVTSAGNESRSIDPPSVTEVFDRSLPVGFDRHPLMVGVAASDAKSLMTSWSSFGPNHVLLAAPGDEIISTVPSNGWLALSGTSMSTPMVAGALARGLSAGLTPEAAIANLAATSPKSAEWRSKVKSGGIINVINFLK